ncbi:hypothetical protein RB195_002088 [Necator americanus]|uniref:Uncharacterized protein n=1 Tax=Necator americanus TaxID=51031 RepID=A0ABR1DIU0_NECAM
MIRLLTCQLGTNGTDAPSQTQFESQEEEAIGTQNKHGVRQLDKGNRMPHVDAQEFEIIQGRDQPSRLEDDDDCRDVGNELEIQDNTDFIEGIEDASCVELIDDKEDLCRVTERLMKQRLI